MGIKMKIKLNEFRSLIKDEIKKALHEFNVSKKFQKAVELYHNLLYQRQQLEKKQKEIVTKFKSSSPDVKQKLKPELINLHKEIKSLESKIAKAERDYNSAIAGEPVNLE
jgi:glutamate racemase